MKTILMSIRPEWAYKIFTDEKIIDVRKGAPPPPFKVVVYCTKAYRLWWKKDETGFEHILNGKIIGEFICDKVALLPMDEYGVLKECKSPYLLDFLQKSCLSLESLQSYGNFKTLQGLHITDPKLYDKPRKLSEFKSPPCSKPEKACERCKHKYNVGTHESPDYDCDENASRPISRPPQSWQYIVDPEEKA